MRGDSRTSAPYACGRLLSRPRASIALFAGSIASFRSREGTMPSDCSTSATSRCSGVTSALFSSVARFCAVMIDSCAFSVNLFRFIAYRRLTVVNLSISSRAVLLRGFALRQRFPMLAIVIGHRRRQLRFDTSVEIAFLVGLADRGHAVALQPEDLAVLRQRRNAQSRGLAAERLHLRLTAKYRRRDRQRHLHIQVAPLSFEHRVRGEPHPQVEVAGCRTPSTLFALPADANARAIADAGGHTHTDSA